MKFFTLFAAGAAASLVQRDLQTVQTALQQITSATENLATQVQNFQGAGQVASLQDASMSTINTVKTQTSNIQGIPQLSQSDALMLVDPVQTLSNDVMGAVQTLIQKKSVFDAAGVSSVVETQVTQLRDAAAAFSSALVSKIPDALQGTAQQLAAPISQALDRAVAAYAGSSSSGPGSSSTSSSGSTAPTSSGSPPSYGGGSSGSATSSAPAETGSSGASSPAGGAGGAAATGSSSPPMYTGAASHQAAGFGAAAVAALAAVAAF